MEKKVKITVILLVAVLLGMWALNREDSSADSDTEPETTIYRENDGTEPTGWDEISLPKEATISDKRDACRKVGGGWLAEHNECELLTADIDDFRLFCTETLEGRYDECESACRHDITADGCIEICVPVCVIEE